MQTRISTKGQIVLPRLIRRKLGLRPGDQLETTVKDGNIVLKPRHQRLPKAAIIRDPLTGLPVLSAGPDAPPLTSEQVEEMLSTFP